jgi:predicted DNA binding CopG/RHH family protein
MPTQVMIRMSDETRQLAEIQAAKLGLNVSEYIRLIIHLDSSTNVIERLKSEYEK